MAKHGSRCFWISRLVANREDPRLRQGKAWKVSTGGSVGESGFAQHCSIAALVLFPQDLRAFFWGVPRCRRTSEDSSRGLVWVCAATLPHAQNAFAEKCLSEATGSGRYG
jgi:hypothetical protein